MRGAAALLVASCVACLVSSAGAVSAAPARLGLAEAIRRASENPAARAARELWHAAAAQAREARSARWPRLTLNAFVAPSPNIDCDDASCSRTSPQEIAPTLAGVFGGARLELLQPLYTFGKLDAGIAAASHAADVQGALADGVVEDVALETARAYFGVLFARDVVAMLADGLEQLDNAQKTLAERLARGDAETTVQDRLRLDTFGAEIRIRASQAREREAIALAGLRALVGEPEAEPELASLTPIDIELTRVESHLARARDRRAEWRAARHGVLALTARTRLEENRFWPDVLLTGAVSITRATAVDNPPSAFANDPFNADRAELALLLRWAFDAGQWARIDRARAEQNRGGALLEVAEVSAEFKVREAYQQALEARSRLEAAELGERSARGWVASVAQTDALGLASARDLADAYLAYFTLRSRTLESTYEWNVAIAALGRATGTLLTIFEQSGGGS